ncbi:putative protein C1orf50-like protein [Aphelenchoides bicaudatus]|nr:putative protein C1orf50-like protein [Aphelenchoides bicaudatus]
MKAEDVIVRDEQVPKVNYVETSDPSETNIVSQKNTHKIHDPNDPVNLLNSIVSSRNIVRTSANAKLASIGQQMDALVEQAKKVMAKCKRDERLHQQVACNFQKKPGATYYLYKKPNDGQEYFSMLSPAEWGSSLKSEYQGCLSS